MEKRKLYAGFWRRAFAHFVDALIASFFVYAAGRAIGYDPYAFLSAQSFKEMPSYFNKAVPLYLPYVITYGVGMCYYVFFWVKWKGASPGKKLLALQIVRKDDKPITIKTAVIRYFSSILSGLVFGLGYIWMLGDKDKQTWHDKLAKTVVIKTKQQPRIAIAIGFIILTYVLLAGIVFSRIYYLFQKEIVQNESTRKELKEKDSKRSQAQTMMNEAMQKLDTASFIVGKKIVTTEDKEEAKKLSTEAVTLLEKATAIDAKNYLSWSYLGEGYSNLYVYDSSVLEKADKAYEKAVTLDTNDPYVYGGLGWVYLTEKKYDKAIPVLERAIKLNSNYARAYYYLGYIHSVEGNRVEAVANFQKAIRLLQPDDPLRDEIVRQLRSI